MNQNNETEIPEALLQKLRESPDDLEALCRIGKIYASQDDFKTAERYFLLALSLDRLSITALTALIDLYRTTGAVEKAIPYIEDIGQSPSVREGRIHHVAELYEKFVDSDKRAGKPPILPRTRILVVNNLFPPQEMGGYGRLLFDFSSKLRGRGHEVRVLTSDADYLGALPEQERHVDRSLKLFGDWKDGKTKTHDNGTTIRVIHDNVVTVENTIRDYCPEVCLFGNARFVGQPVIELLLKHNIPTIHHLGFSIPQYPVKDTPQSPKYRLAAASKWVRQSTLDAGYPLKKIDVVYPGAEVRKFKINSLPSHNKLNIAYAGILMPYKGPDVLISALTLLHTHGVDFTCTMAGKVWNESVLEALQAHCRRYGFLGKVSFVGNLDRERLKHMFAKCNVLVFPSTVNEAFGISQVEAMAAGLPVIGTGTGGAQEVIDDGNSGIIFRKKDPGSLATALMKLSADSGKWKRMGLNAQARAIELFDIEHSVDQLEGIFAELLGIEVARIR